MRVGNPGLPGTALGIRNHARQCPPAIAPSRHRRRIDRSSGHDVQGSRSGGNRRRVSQLRDGSCGLESEGATDRRQRPHALFRRPPPPAARSGSRHEACPLKKLIRNVLRSSWIQRAVGFLAAEYLRLVWLTNKFSFDPPEVYESGEPQQPAIFAFWHGQPFMTPFINTRESHRGTLLTSRHHAGE